MSGVYAVQHSDVCGHHMHFVDNDGGVRLEPGRECRYAIKNASDSRSGADSSIAAVAPAVGRRETPSH